MNENLQAALAELINKAIGGIDTSAEFLKEQLPDVIQQALLWYGVQSFLYFVLGSIILIATYIGSVWSVKKIISSGVDEILYIPVIAAFVLLNVIGFNTASMEWLQIWIAPKLWLIEYAAKLV